MDVAFQLLSGKCIDWDSAKTSFIEGLVSGLLPGGAVTDFLVGMAVDIGMRGETPANAFGNQMLGLGLDKFLRGFGKGARGADNAPRNGLRCSPTEAVERAGKNLGREFDNIIDSITPKRAYADGVGDATDGFNPRVMRSSSSGGGGGTRKINPNELSFSQSTAGMGQDRVTGRRGANILRDNMRENGWDPAGTVDVVQTPTSLTTMDNTRVAVAQELGIEEITINIHQMNDLLPENMISNERFGNATTWGEALSFRTSSQNNPSIDSYGTPQRPRLPKYKKPEDF